MDKRVTKLSAIVSIFILTTSLMSNQIQYNMEEYANNAVENSKKEMNVQLNKYTYTDSINKTISVTIRATSQDNADLILSHTVKSHKNFKIMTREYGQHD